MPEGRFPAMGSTAHVIVAGDSSLVDAARRRIDDLEEKWSRFKASSEVSRLNAASRRSVSWETLELIERSVAGWEATDGRFDPTVHDALVAHGYDRTLALVRAAQTPDHDMPAPGCEGIRLDRETRIVELPEGTHLDPGGIGKGLAADLTAEELMTMGADGVLVNIGGDLRASGPSPEGPGWSIELEGPPDAESPGIVSMLGGAVASSTPLKRRWGGHHHLIDPGRGRPIERPHRFVAAVAAEAWWAEVATKDLMGLAAGATPLDGVAALVIDADAEVHRVGGMEAYL